MTSGHSSRYHSVTPASLVTGQIIVHDALLRASSVDVLRGPQALEHRRPHKEGSGAFAVYRNRAHLVETIASPRWILFLQDALVLDCHRLEKFIGDKAPLPVIQVEQTIRLTGEYTRNLPGQADRIVNAEIHAHAAEWIVDVRGVAGQQDAIAAVSRRDPLMYGVQIGVGSDAAWAAG